MFRLPVVFFTIILAASTATAQALNWQPYDAVWHGQGRISYSSDSYVFAAAADSGGLVYALSRSVNVSTDDGHTWTVVGVGDESDIAAGPHRGEAVTAGTPAYTSDGGQHWTALAAPWRGRQCAFGKDGWIYLAAESNVCAASGPSGQWITSPKQFGSIMDLWIAPDGMLSVFAFNSSDTAIYRSSDHGLTWSISCHVPYPYAGYGVSEDGRGHIAVHADGDPEYVSSDFGRTWSRVDSLVFYMRDITISVPRYSPGARITVAGTTRMFYGGRPLCITPDGVIVGDMQCSAAPYDTVYSYHLREYTPGTIIGRNDTEAVVAPYSDRCAFDSSGYFYERAGNVQGRRVNVYTPDDKMRWTVLDAAQVFQLRGAPDRSVYASGSHGILYHTTDRGWSWSEIAVATGRLLFFDITSNGEFYVVNDSNVIYHSSDAVSWNVVGAAPSHMTTFYATNRGLVAVLDSAFALHVVRSTDNGITWKSEETPLPLLYLDVLPDGSLITATMNHIYLNRSGSWQAIDENLPRRIDYDSSQTVYSSVGHDMGGHLYVGVVNAGLYRSELAYQVLSVAHMPNVKPLKLSVYPNPATGSIYIDVPASVSAVSIRDALGREVLTEIATTETLRIDISRLPAGIYSLETIGEGAPSFARVLVR